MINVYGKLPNESEVLLAQAERAGDAQAIKKEWGDVFKDEGITFRVEVAKITK